MEVGCHDAKNPDVEQTSHSLLQRLRERPTPDDWSRLVAVYDPWIRDWLRRQGVQDHDAADITQEVLSCVVSEMPQFRYDSERGRFRGWLRTITLNRLRAFWKARPRHVSLASGDGAAMLEQLADPHSGLSQQWDREHDAHVLRQAMTAVRPEFRPATWEAFDRVVLHGEPVDAVARQLGMTRNAVYIAQSRVLARLRDHVRGLCEL